MYLDDKNNNKYYYMANRPSKEYCYCAERHCDVNNLILQEFAKEVSKEICVNSDGVQMPHPFGRIYVVGVNNNNKPLDHKSSTLYNKLIYFTNDDTNGYVFRAITKFKPKSFRLSFFYTLKPYKLVKYDIRDTIKGGNWTHWGQYKSIKDTR